MTVNDYIYKLNGNIYLSPLFIASIKCSSSSNNFICFSISCSCAEYKICVTFCKSDSLITANSKLLCISSLVLEYL